MAVSQATTASMLHQVLDYDPNTGDFRWLASGKIAGSIQSGGYRRIMIDGRTYAAGRLAFLYMTGNWPNGQVDHINRIRDDNRWANLRECTQSQNMMNTGLRRTNTSGIQGVSFVTTRKRWQASVCINGRAKFLGYFPTKEEARDFYNAAVKPLRGEFYRSVGDV